MTSPATPPPVSSRFPILWRDTQAGRAERFVREKMEQRYGRRPEPKKDRSN